MAPSFPPSAFVHSNALALTPTLTRASTITAVNQEISQEELTPEEVGHFKAVSVILVCLLGFMVSNMSQLAINVLLPIIQRDLPLAFATLTYIEVNSADLQWLSSGFTLGYGCCLLMAGRLADIYGHKRSLLIGLVIFAAFSLASALARSLHQLAIFRAIQGLGAGAISSSLLAILGRTFVHGTKMRTEAFAGFSTGSPLGSSLGLFVGGFQAKGTAPGWRSVFYLFLAVSSLAAILAFFVLPPDPPRAPEKNFKQLDWTGAFLIGLGLNLLVISLAISPHYTWTSPVVVVPLIISPLLFCAFFSWEYNLELNGPGAPLIKMSLFKNKCYSAVHGIAGLLWITYVNHNYFLNQYFQNYLALPLKQTLLRFLPILVTGLLLGLFTGWLIDHWSAQKIMIVGCLASAVACLLTSIMDTSAVYWNYNLVSITLSIIGADFVFAVGSMFAMQFAEHDDLATVGAMFLTFTQFFFAVGLSLATIVQVTVTRRRSLALGFELGGYITKAPREAYLLGLRSAFWLSFSSVALATVIAVAFLWGMGHVGAGSSEPKATKEHKDLESASITRVENRQRSRLSSATHC